MIQILLCMALLIEGAGVPQENYPPKGPEGANGPMEPKKQKIFMNIKGEFYA
jgi:hypothetical protein